MYKLIALLQEDKMYTRFKTDSKFIPFASVPKPLINFIIAEKCYFSEQAVKRLVDGKDYGINVGDTVFLPEKYHPRCMSPFEIKAFWIPLYEGEFFCMNDKDEHSLCRRTVDGHQEFLFFVHPMSESLFTPLMNTYAHTEITCYALSLSSSRTLLVSIPHSDGSFELAQVKTSLDTELAHARRVLTRKEVGLSIGNSCALNYCQTDYSGIHFLLDSHGFLPSMKLLSKGAETKGAGMLVRPLPNYLLSESSHHFIVPLSALTSFSGSSLLEEMIARSGYHDPIVFIEETIVTPLAQAYTYLLFEQNISIEAHGQNLLLAIDSNTLQPLHFCYRDMGGVNVLLYDDILERLPDPLKSTEFYYQTTHVDDAANALEKFIAQSIFSNFTKRILQSDLRNKSFSQWESNLGKHIVNWATLDEKGSIIRDGNHTQQLRSDEFLNYGYFEIRFGESLVTCLKEKNILSEIAEKKPELTDFLSSEKLLYGLRENQQVGHTPWFFDLVQLVYRNLYF